MVKWMRMEATVITCLFIYDWITVIIATKEISNVAILAILYPNPSLVAFWKKINRLIIPNTKVGINIPPRDLQGWR